MVVPKFSWLLIQILIKAASAESVKRPRGRHHTHSVASSVLILIPSTRFRMPRTAATRAQTAQKSPFTPSISLMQHVPRPLFPHWPQVCRSTWRWPLVPHPEHENTGASLRHSEHHSPLGSRVLIADSTACSSNGPVTMTRTPHLLQVGRHEWQ